MKPDIRRDSIIAYIKQHYPKQHRYLIAKYWNVRVRLIATILRDCNLMVACRTEFYSLEKAYRKTIAAGGNRNALAARNGMTDHVLELVMGKTLLASKLSVKDMLIFAKHHKTIRRVCLHRLRAGALKHYKKGLHRFQVAKKLGVSVQSIAKLISEHIRADEWTRVVSQYKIAVREHKDLERFARRHGFPNKKTMQTAFAETKCPSPSDTLREQIVADYKLGLHRFQLAHKYSRTTRLIHLVLRDSKLMKRPREEFKQLIQDYERNPESL